jgi:hypothetical protein
MGTLSFQDRMLIESLQYVLILEVLGEIRKIRVAIRVKVFLLPQFYHIVHGKFNEEDNNR